MKRYRLYCHLRILILSDYHQSDEVGKQDYDKEVIYSMPKSSNASASAFGWDFQSNAAIMLMLKNIVDASKVKVEGDSEDVEITFSNGKMLMAQAKSVMDPDDFSFVTNKLKDALKTLNNASKISDVEQLVFVTNSPNPFNDIATMYKFSSPLNIIPFSELPMGCQQSISDICSTNGYSIDTSMLTVCVMQFYGHDEDERYKVLRSLTEEFLNRLGVERVSTGQILSLWQHSFAVNATQRTSAITKESMVWPIIAILCEVRENDTVLEDYDSSDAAEILRKYRAVINNNCERFEFISKVLSDFNEFYPEMISRERRNRFISEKWEQYKNDFDLKNADSETEKVVICLTVSNILKNRKVIAEIKGKVKL